jgi:hypothetical protein
VDEMNWRSKQIRSRKAAMAKTTLRGDCSACLSAVLWAVMMMMKSEL